MCSSRGLVAVVSFLAGVASFGAIVEGGDFVRHPDGGAVRAKTSFAISSDPQDWNLVVDIDCEVRDLAKFRAADGDGGDHVEVFLSPDGNVQHYYQFMVNAKGEKRFAAYFEEKGDIQPDPYMPEWKYERRETEKGWAVRITIPYYSLYMTRNDRWSGVWLVNVARGNGIDGEKSTWNRLYGSFHDADHFRRVSGFPKRQKPFDVVIESAEVMIDGVRDGRYRGKMKVFARSLAPAMYTLRTSVSEPVTAKVISTGSPIYVDCSFPNLGRNVVDFELQLQKPWGKWTGRYARSYPVMVAFDPLKVKLTVPAYRDSFYPGQATDRVAGVVTNEAPGEIRLTLEGGGMPLTERTLPKSGAFSFDTSSFTNGEMVLTVVAGTETRRMRIRKIEPNGHRMSWIENGVIRVDGKPMFPKSMAAEGYKGGEAFAKRFFSDKGLLRTSEELSRVRIEAKRLVKGIEDREAKKDVKPCAELLAAMDRVIEENRGKDFGWYYLCDEPEMRGISEIYLRHCYEHIKSRDPYHVVGIHSRNAARFIEAADWFETHPYLDPHLDGEGLRIYNIAINRFGDFVSPVADLGRPDKVIGVIPTCFSYRFKNPLSDYPTWDEYNCTTWATILRGARSIQPFFYADMGDRFWLYEGTKRIFRTISALEDLLLFGKRTALKRSASGDATLYEFGDERMFVAVNFENAPHALRIGDLSGHFREFGGTREWTGVTTLEMKPLEVIIATTRKRDDGIGSAADFRKVMDRAEGARTHRDNQLLGKEKEIEVRAKFDRNPLFNTSFKLFDGVRDVLAWSGAGKDNAMELAFKDPRTMRSLRLYGAHLEKTTVCVKSGGGWKRLEPVSDDSKAFSRVLFFPEPVGVEALLLEFGPDPVELYEIEIPAEPVRAVVPVEQKAGWAIKWWMPRHREKLAAATNGHHRVVFLGDSITHYWETNGSNVWNRCFAGAPYHALDLGFSGDRTEHLLWRIGNGELDGYETDCIVLLIGTNNSGQLSLDAEPPEHTVLGIKAVLEAIRRKQPKAKVILTAIFPCRLDPNAGVEQRNRKVNAEIRKLADGQEVIWLDLNERFLKPYGGHSQKLFPDIVHPNEAGYEIWAKALVPEIDRVLGSMGATIFAETTPPLLPMPQKVAWRDGCSSAAIRFVADETVPAEGYRLDVAPEEILVRTSDAAGRFYAERTLRQLAGKDGYRCCVIEDAPAYSWRGLHFDDGRHFFGKDEVKRTIDLMADYKLNVFHWHLTEDQGWRLAIDAYPRLVEVGSVRPSSVREGSTKEQDGVRYGPFFYTKSDIREVVAYAAERHVKVVPEIEIPGHAKAALAAYPEFSCRGEALEPKEPWCAWGVSKDIICAGNDGAIRFLEKVLDEVCELFPSDVIHIGGDEAPKDRWKECPKCQARIKALGLRDEEALQGWVVRHFTEYLAAKGRRAIGWDEILAGGNLPKETMVQTWRGWRTAEDAIVAVKAGHDVVMSPNRECYFDYWQGLDPRQDPYDYIGAVTTVRTNGWSGRSLPLEKVFRFDPRKGIPDGIRTRILGGQGNNWSEYTRGREDLEWKMWPRALALSEALWTANPARSYEEFRPRAAAHRARLRAAGVNAAPIPGMPVGCSSLRTVNCGLGDEGAE